MLISPNLPENTPIRNGPLLTTLRLMVSPGALVRLSYWTTTWVDATRHPPSLTPKDSILKFGEHFRASHWLIIGIDLTVLVNVCTCVTRSRTKPE